MYNRYIKNDQGSYMRIPQEEPDRADAQAAQQTHQEASNQKDTVFSHADPLRGGVSAGISDFLRHFLDRLHLDHIDTGDLLLLVLLFFLFREDADEELLIALALLLIL